MTRHFSFPYTQKLQTDHPRLEVEVIFWVNAEIIDNEDETVVIKTVYAKSAIDYVETVLIAVPMPDESNFEGSNFWALIREAARTHFYKMQKQNK